MRAHTHYTPTHTHTPRAREHANTHPHCSSVLTDIEIHVIRLSYKYIHRWNNLAQNILQFRLPTGKAVQNLSHLLTQPIDLDTVHFCGPPRISTYNCMFRRVFEICKVVPTESCKIEGLPKQNFGRLCGKCEAF
jgi:hypothetical protein